MTKNQEREIRERNVLRTEQNCDSQSARDINVLLGELEVLRIICDEQKSHADFGRQCYQDRCEGAFIEFSVVKKLEERIEKYERVEFLKMELEALKTELKGG